MPVSPRPQAVTVPSCLRPYTFHGVHLSTQGSHAVGDCPFCGREGKFSVEVASGLWRCFVCGVGTVAGGGNGLVFTRLVYERAAAGILCDPTGISGTFRDGVARDRRLLSPDTVSAWGILAAPDGTWLVPGYGTDGKLDQVYRRVRVQDHGEWTWRLLPTPDIWPPGKVHSLHLPVGDFDPSCPDVYICEGPWDGMALWEVARGSSIAPCQVLAVPGCNVWRDEWTEFCRDKRVTLLFDSDHPREYTLGRTSRAGYDGMVRIAKRLSGVAASVRWLRWGEEGYDPSRPSGWDVRDELTGGSLTLSDRDPLLAGLLAKVEDAPREWFLSTSPTTNGQPRHTGSVESLPCSKFAACEAAWVDAMRWRRDMGDALATLLAVCASTQQAGNQLFLDLIGSPGGAKTTLCRGLLVSGHCVHLENATKLMSGWRKPDDSGKDCSFLARANGKTWVTCEFDVLVTLPQYNEIMGKVRRIFDGETSATYGNSDEDRVYTALRTPWIRAGTHRMVDQDQSQLGDRFLRFILDDPDVNERREIARSALRSERLAMVESANCTSGSTVDPKTRLAQALTGGYVDWLRASVEGLLGHVDVSVEVEDYCIDLAELAADLRARPTDDGHGHQRNKRAPEPYETKELPTRLARQNIRLASCLAVVLNKSSVDSDVLRIVRKVALDTAAGHSLNIVRWLSAPNPRAGYVSYQESGGLMTGILGTWTCMTPERLEKYLMFLRKIGVLDLRDSGHSRNAWFLTERVHDLYLRIVSK